MNLYLLRLIGISYYDIHPNEIEMFGFGIVSVLLSFLLVKRYRKLNARTNMDGVKLNQLLPEILPIDVVKANPELRKYSLLSRVVAIGLILLILSIPCIDLTQMQIFAG